MEEGMKKVLSVYLRPYYGRMLIGFIVKFIGTIMDLCLPWILAYMIDTIIPQGTRNLIYLWGLVMLVCSVLALTFNVLANRMASKVARDTTETIRHDLFEKIMWLSNAKTDEFTKPSLISRLTTDTYNVHQMLGRVQRLGVRAPILVVGGILVTLTLDPVLTLVLMSVMPLTAFVTYYFSRKSIPMYHALQKAVDQFVRLLREDIAGIRVIKALSKTDYEKEKYETLNKEVVTLEKKADVTMAIVNPATNLFLNLGIVLVVIAGAYRVHQGYSEVGKILAFLTYFTIILNAMIIDVPQEVEQTLCEKLAKDGAYICFDHVTFSYHAGEPSLSDISFSLQKGETLGIIGATGAGKSTIAALLMRFYYVNEGTISIGGENIRTIPTGRLRELFGVVFQNDTIFEDTIAENVRMGRTLSDDDIRKAVMHAKAKEFVEAAGRGYDNQCTRGKFKRRSETAYLNCAGFGGTSGYSDFGRFFERAGLPDGRVAAP